MQQKELYWISSSKKDLSKFPKDALNEAIFALDLAREGDTYHKIKPLKGFHGADMKELVLEDRAGTFRVIYKIKFENVIYVSHAFQKKSKKGKKTPKKDIDLIHSRLAQALVDHKERIARGKAK